MSLSHQYIQGYCRSMVSLEDVVRARMLLELLFVRLGAFCLDNFTPSDVKVMTDSLSTWHIFALFLFFFICFFCTSCTIFIINI